MICTPLPAALHPIRFTTVDRKDVSTELKIKPHISEGGTVCMEISEEVSTVIAATANNQNGPSTTKRSLDINNAG